MSNNRSPGGIILPPNAKVVAIQAQPYQIGGTPVEAPPDPRLVLQVHPSVLQKPNELLGLLAAVLNVNNALVREVDRLRTHAGLPAWTPELGATPDEPTQPDEAPEETPQAKEA